FTASVTVTNSGKVAGKEAVQLYVSAPSGGLEKPAKELKAFAKTKLLAPGESQTLVMEVSAYELASFNENAGRWETAAGSYTVNFASNVADVRCTAPFVLKAQKTFSVDDPKACAPKE
ncbi:MAG: fibronectin type III-like domain-contianing protein, partial [Bacteroidales bacterium]|nr:fibronectin type III-like domain-contianing protein [Bacteroidales bacterium]